MPRGPKGLIVYLITLLAALTWGLPLLSGVDFSYDDREAIVGNPVVEGQLPALEAFQRDYWHHLEDAGHYRPLATVLLRMDRSSSSKPEPLIFRRTNVILHVLIVALLGIALLRLTGEGRSPFPWFGLAVFAVHPASADVVAWISGRTSLVSGLGAAGGLLLLSFAETRRWIIPLAAGIGTGFALLGKEDGVVVAAALPLFAWWRFGMRAALAAALGAGVAVLAVMGLRAAALGSPLPSSTAPTVGDAELTERVALGLGAWWHGIAGAFTPWEPSSPSLRVEDVQPRRWLWLLWLVGAAGGTVLLQWRSQAGAKAAALGLAAMCLAALPLLQIVPAGELFAPRFLYQPFLFGTVAVSWLACAAFTIFGRARVPLLVACILGLAAVSATSASARYASRLSFWRSFPQSQDDWGHRWNALGEAEREVGNLEAAELNFRRATELDPGRGAPFGNLGSLAMRRGDWEDAESLLLAAIQRDPECVTPRANLANLRLREKRPQDALDLYREAIAHAPGRASLHRGLARAYLRTGDLEGAQTSVEEALRLLPNDPIALRLADEIEIAPPK